MASPCQLCTFRLQLFGLRTLVLHWLKVYLIIQLFVLCSLDVTEAAMCKKTGPCSCLSSRMNVNLSSIAVPDKRYKVPGDDKKNEFYFYNPCKTFDEPADGTGCKDTLVPDKVSGTNMFVPDMEFIVPDMLCQQSGAATKYYYPMGTLKHVIFTGSPEDNNLMILYNETTKNVNRQSKVALICDSTTPAAFKFVEEKPQTKYKFELRTSHVCLPASSQGISTGSVLVILFFVFLVIYLVGGVLFLRFARGAQGSEMIPNRAFWLDFPWLVKDGVYFVCRGCKTDTYYEQI